MWWRILYLLLICFFEDLSTSSPTPNFSNVVYWSWGPLLITPISSDKNLVGCSSGLSMLLQQETSNSWQALAAMRRLYNSLVHESIFGTAGFGWRCGETVLQQRGNEEATAALALKLRDQTGTRGFDRNRLGWMKAREQNPGRSWPEAGPAWLSKPQSPLTEEERWIGSRAELGSLSRRCSQTKTRTEWKSAKVKTAL